jgi:hypothetical protein
MLGCDVLLICITPVSSKMSSRIVLAGVFGLAILESLLISITGILGSLHQYCSRCAIGHIGLLHGFNESVFDTL